MGSPVQVKRFCTVVQRCKGIYSGENEEFRGWGWVRLLDDILGRWLKRTFWVLNWSSLMEFVFTLHFNFSFSVFWVLSGCLICLSKRMEHKKIVTELNLNKPHQGPGLFSLYLFTPPPSRQERCRWEAANEWMGNCKCIGVGVSVCSFVCVYLLNIYLIF